MAFRMVVRGADRDSMLYRVNDQSLDLALRYRIELVRCEPTTAIRIPGLPRTFAIGDGNLNHEGVLYDLAKWSDWEWAAFSNAFPRVIKDFWDEKFELSSNQAWFLPLPHQKSTAPNVTCSLDIELVNLAAQSHQRYYIIKLAPDAPSFRSFAFPFGRLGVFTQKDLTPIRRHKPTRIGHGRHSAVHTVTYFQTVALHEFGHTLGLDHIRAEFGNDPKRAYGTTLEERSNEMGDGNEVNTKQAEPWISQMRHHFVGSKPPRFKARIIAPQMYSFLYID